MDDLDEEIQCTSSKFVNDTRLGGSVELLESGKTIMGCGLAEANCMRFSETRCWVLCIGHNSPMQCCWFGTECMATCAAGKDLGL